MAVIDHWHPICRLKDVAKGPVGAIVDTHPVAVFRTESGQLGVLEDACPHRRMRLSRGKVCGERLQCCYHGWTFDTHGHGESPGSPKMHARAGCFEGREDLGWIWVRRAGTRSHLPPIRYRCSRVRMNRLPPTAAGDATVSSPRSHSATTRKVRAASTIMVLPSLAK
jgi:phenylpropionate dioxygenase-like ring-hydroxylating dioxygenase large terminal subunit